MKWPGGKRRVLKHIQPVTPTEFEAYYEPFLGGGAVLMDLDPKMGFASDINSELINAYNVIKSSPGSLLDELKKHEKKNDLAYFLKVRAYDRDAKLFSTMTDVEKAARAIYLNRTCFNGLYRVNASNQFNVPYGNYSDPKIVDTTNINALSSWFNKHQVVFKHQSYDQTLANVIPGSFVYLDPPYVPASPTASFTSYTSGKFNMADQEQVAETAKRLDKEGNMVLLSNSDTPIVRELYKDFTIKSIDVTRSIGASGGTRKKAGEVLIISDMLAENLNLSD